jgi:hypothetical protein
VLEQALRDVVAWVERGQEPPPSTQHEVVDGQVLVPARAAERKGIQPTVALTVDGRDRIEVAAGEEVAFTALVEVPPGTGTIVAVEWDFDGAGEYPERSFVDGSATRLQVTATHAFDESGTYFPAVRVTSHRHGRRKTDHARVQELGRVRVVVGGGSGP